MPYRPHGCQFGRNMKITNDEIIKAEMFFSQNNVDILAAQARRFNKEQPNFTATVRAMEMHGLAIEKVEDLLLSIFVIYYVQTVLKKKRVNTISIGQIAKNIASFESFLNFYNKEKTFEADVDLSKVKFINDETVLHYALLKLIKLFGTIRDIPREVFFSYFALLKGIEIGAEKAG